MKDKQNTVSIEYTTIFKAMKNNFSRLTDFERSFNVCNMSIIVSYH